jgi:hypothetical protein
MPQSGERGNALSLVTIVTPSGNILLRGRWEGENTFILEYPYPTSGLMVLGELGETEFQLKLNGDQMDVSVQQLFLAESRLFSQGKDKRGD